MAPHETDPVIHITDLPDYPEPVALHGARLGSGAALGANDDLWIIAVILVYETGG
ncbi:MAG: hypothetical protein Q27BB25_01800 [Blastomonas sp. CACIA14H2]|jgi:hypothetical protein|uniref:hypothetical protein n=1 Tax=unclassified Blastomonas TaxID=2626550 RepID=UPI0003D06ED6|nr:hypothetical protein [Blastomonas sp. UPD001]ESZ88933.1 MAG: hypothetical protein Q27BB25_01800 [Blastomonas sp. CACIA14H2]